eukprot:1153381-Prymnesium_polylepis.1
MEPCANEVPRKGRSQNVTPAPLWVVAGEADHQTTAVAQGSKRHIHVPNDGAALLPELRLLTMGRASILRRHWHLPLRLISCSVSSEQAGERRLKWRLQDLPAVQGGLVKS